MILPNYAWSLLVVCGQNAACKAALHRPVCSCEDGFEGNAYDKCTKVGFHVSFLNFPRYLYYVSVCP